MAEGLDERLDLLLRDLHGVPPHEDAAGWLDEVPVTERQLLVALALAYYSSRLGAVSNQRMVAIMDYARLDEDDRRALYNLADDIVLERIDDAGSSQPEDS